MSGWKTKLGAALIAASGAAAALGYIEVGALLLKIGTAIAAIGIAHKIEKAGSAQ